MAHANSIAAALVLAAAAAPLAAAPGERAPAGNADTRYCMKVEAVTGTRLERTECWTREQWAEQGVDVDREWPKEGVRTIG
jgi:hypothetical protein